MIARFGARRIALWTLTVVLALAGIVASEYARRSNVHDYSSNRSRMVWPQRLTLDATEFTTHLRQQFNVDLHEDRNGDGLGDLSLRAGLCQLAGKSSIEPIDVLAAEATLLILQEPWFDDFVASEKARLNEVRSKGAWTEDELRKRFVQDLAASEPFRADFPRLMTDVAAKRDIVLEWSRGLADPLPEAEHLGQSGGTSMPSDLKINYVELPASDMDEIERFYGKAFGWTFVDYGPDYRAFNDGDLDGGFFKSDLRSGTENGAALIVLFAGDLEAARDAVVSHGGRIQKDIFSFPGGRRFHFLDPHGNELAIWSDK